VLPALPYQASHLESSTAGTPDLGLPLKHTPIDQFNIPSLRDVLVKEYCAWQQSQVDDETQKVEYEQASQMILAEHMDLGLIH
jgi:hypothetical protein